MYTISEVMGAVAADSQRFALVAILVYVIAGICYLYGVALQFREKKCPWWFWMHAWYIGHDVTFVSLYDLWFNQINYWLFKVLWVGCLMFIVIELATLYMLVKHERQEVFGRYTKGEVTVKQAWIRGISGYLFGIALFYIIRLAIGDVMCLMLMMSTNAIAAMFPAFLAEQRGSREGHSIMLGVFNTINTIFTFLPAGFGFWATAAAVFRQPWYSALGVLSVFCALRYIYVLSKFPKKGLLPNGKKPIY